LVITFALQEMIGLNAAIALILGSNIGTCVTALLASIGTTLTARRAAIAHVIFKSFGVVLFFPFLNQFASLMASTSPILARQVANAHTIFNIVVVAIILPLLKYFIQFIIRLVPGEEVNIPLAPKFLDVHLLNTPSVAMGQVTKELLHMGELAVSMMDDVFKAFDTGNLDSLKHAVQKETAINTLERETVTYLVKIAQKSLSNEQSTRHRALLNMANDIERVGDHTENMMELVIYKDENRVQFSEVAKSELFGMYNDVRGLLCSALDALREDNILVAQDIIKRENEIDHLERSLRHSHMTRLNEGKCSPTAGVVFLDTISNLERIADHANDIAEMVLGV
ncbi:MAG TPA: Na/Pi cotransporter family protein, partial [Bacillota bacterium]|nr:Na/Pi cotransporter family protein [Bacillota bacterium]